MSNEAVRTIRLTAEPLSRYSPPTGGDDEVAIYVDIVLYTFDTEHSAMWLYGCERMNSVQCRKALVEEAIMNVAQVYKPRPVLLQLDDGRIAHALLYSPEGLRIEDAAGGRLAEFPLQARKPDFLVTKHGVKDFDATTSEN